MTRLLILGAGTFALDVLEAVRLARSHEPVGFVVSDASLVAQPSHGGLPVTHLAALTWTPADVQCVAGITNPKRQAFIEQVQDRGFTFVNVVHPAAIVSTSATIAPGCFVGAGAIVGARTALGDHALVNRGANLGHDVRVGAFATIGPGAVLAGSVIVGSGVTIGIGAVVQNGLTIGQGSAVATGAVVVRSVPDHTLVAGSPARVARSGTE